VGVENLTWRCLEEGKIFLFTSSFNLYTSYKPARCAKYIICDGLN
jgi:hypothetical protein